VTGSTFPEQSGGDAFDFLVHDRITICARCGYAAWRDGYPCNRCGGLEPRVYVPLSEVSALLGDQAHPDWSDYVATNLLDALEQVPDTGDWHGALRAWCGARISGKLAPNRTGASGQKGRPSDA
jgi:hypothetical protein